MKLFAMLMLAVAPVQEQPQSDVVLLDFYAGYCQPCQRMVPVLQEMGRDGYVIRKVDAVQHPEFTRSYRVEALPTFVVLVEGKEVRRFKGEQRAAVLRNALDDAKRQLAARRKKASRLEAERTRPRRQPEATEPPVPGDGDSKPTGIGGFFDRVKRGLGGESNSEQPADYRGQSPDAEAPSQDGAMDSTVRVRIIDGNMRDFGTGTIVHSEGGQSTILTCAHMFKGVRRNAPVAVDVFQGGTVLKYPATVVCGDHNSDLAFLTIQNSTPLPASPIASQLNLRQNDPLFSIGCNNGDLPTRLNMNVVAIDAFDGPENIVCTLDPAQGRSGGGLFNTSGELVGVCSGAFRDKKQGLYSGVKPIISLAENNKLDYLIKRPTPSIQSQPGETAIAEDVTNPFAEDEAGLMLAEATPGFVDFDQPSPGFGEPAMDDMSRTVSDLTAMSGGNLPDPFATAAAPATATAGPAEITVIVDSKDPSRSKRVIVIPNPSPWILELLTGEPNGGVQLRNRDAIISTSARKMVPQISRPVYRVRVRRPLVPAVSR